MIAIVLLVAEKSRSGKTKRSGGGLVISPQGIALSMPQLKGEMKWKELQKIELVGGGQSPVCIRLSIAGASIVLPEEFELPLWYLYERFQAARLEQADEVDSELVAPIDIPEDDENLHNPFRPPQR